MTKVPKPMTAEQTELMRKVQELGGEILAAWIAYQTTYLDTP